MRLLLTHLAEVVVFALPRDGLSSGGYLSYVCLMFV
jgi:hypothetical protein